ncbi:MAG: hypothetical protein LBU12_03105 [Deltaproteobacteria bacterium]|jgi:hypothetical protein|nr:hypothetical protein [Deltaproteobacteria bacterium]
MSLKACTAIALTVVLVALPALAAKASMGGHGCCLAMTAASASEGLAKGAGRGHAGHVHSSGAERAEFGDAQAMHQGMDHAMHQAMDQAMDQPPQVGPQADADPSAATPNGLGCDVWQCVSSQSVTLALSSGVDQPPALGAFFKPRDLTCLSKLNAYGLFRPPRLLA